MNTANTGSLGFNTEVALIVGVEAAVLYQNISFWVETNRANKRNFYEDKYWTFNSARAFSELFPFWSSSKVVRLLTKLEEKNLIESGEFNQKGYDRTKWYTTVEDTIFRNRKMHLSESENAFVGIGKPIPDINTDINTKDVQKEKKDKITYNSTDVKLTDSLYQTIAKFFPNHSKLVKRKAKDSDYMELNKLNRIDGYDYKDIEKVLRWLYTAYIPSDRFDWKKQILSTTKLRKHFFQLSEQCESDKNNPKNRTYKYDTAPPSERKPKILIAERERVVSAEEAEKNQLILELIRKKKATFAEHKNLKSKTIQQLQAMLDSV